VVNGVDRDRELSRPQHQAFVQYTAPTPVRNEKPAQVNSQSNHSDVEPDVRMCRILGVSGKAARYIAQITVHDRYTTTGIPSSREGRGTRNERIVRGGRSANALQAMFLSPISFLETQDDGVPSQDLAIARLPSRSATESPLRPNLNAPLAPTLSPSPNLAAKSPLSARQNIRTPPKARLRHDDSQIQFAAIESSPLAPEPANSNHLTDRQKEVKERQGLEAAMFPEIRSSPKSASRPAEYSLPKLVFKRNYEQGSKPAVDEEVSPLYPPDILMNDFLGSSPTPASSKKGTDGIGSLYGPPSLPPFISSQRKVSHQIIPPVPLDLHGQPMVEAQGHISSQLLKGNQSNTERDSDIGKNSSTIDAAAYAINHPKDNLVPAAATLRPEDRIMSDFDVFVDAVSEPNENVLASFQNNGVSTVYNSFPIDGSSNLASEDDQVTAQLISEMERASSQHSNKEDEVKPASGAPSKRKNAFGEGVNALKRARGMPTFPDPLKRVRTPAAGQAVAECVMIDVRPAQVQLPESLGQVKRERSHSPAVAENIRTAGKSPVARKRRGRPPEKSWPSQPWQEASSTPSSRRQSQATPESDVNDASMAKTSQKSARKSARLSNAVTSNPPGSVTSAAEKGVSEPGSLTNSGKRKASRFWYYTTEESHKHTGANGNASTSDEDDIAVAATGNGSTKSGTLEHQQQLSGQQRTTAHDAQDHGRRASTSNQDEEVSQPEAAADIGISDDPPTAEGIVQELKKMVSNIKRVALGREDEREISKLLFQSLGELHEAGRRHTAM